MRIHQQFVCNKAFNLNSELGTLNMNTNTYLSKPRFDMYPEVVKLEGLSVKLTQMANVTNVGIRDMKP